VLRIRQKFGPIKRTVVWFSRDPRFDGGTTFYQSFADVDAPGYVRETWQTLAIDLRVPDDELLGNMRSTTRNEIRQMVRKDPVVIEHLSVNTFVRFYNDFAREKKTISPVAGGKILSFGESFRVTGVSYLGELLAVHAYLVDPDERRTRLMYSATCNAGKTEGISRNDIAKANRYLHFVDMGLFRNQGMYTYDFGGYAPDSDDPAKVSIAQFKAGFGGKPETFIHYKPWWFALLHRVGTTVR
jgi:hypothetical protein